MPTPTKKTPASRSEAEVFADLGALCVLPGFIHAVAYFCFRDNLFIYKDKLVAKDLQHQYSSGRLLTVEIATLLGLMVKKPVDLALPKPPKLQDYIDRSEALLEELHHALTQPWSESLDFKSGEIPDKEPFNTAAAMREPIFPQP